MKMSTLWAFFLWLSCTLSTARAAPPNTLQLVSLLFNHGARSPMSIYPKDINQQSAWPDGLGWLTNHGKQQQYTLGQFIKERYDGFISTSHYNHEEIKVDSSGEKSCLMSAYSTLAGLFPPSGDQSWHPGLKWQPVPVKSRPAFLDNKLALKEDCPRYVDLLHQLFRSSAVQEEEKRNADFYEIIQNKTGVAGTNLHTAFVVADTLSCEKAESMSWNDWVYEPGVWDKLTNLSDYVFGLKFHTSEMARLATGPLLREIIEHMHDVVRSTTHKPKMFMYSAYEYTVAGLLKGMHVFQPHKPDFSSLVMVELHRIDAAFEVKIFYKNDSTADAYQLFPEGCPSPCTLKKFVDTTRDSVPVNWSKECKAEYTGTLSSAMIAVVVLGIVMVTVCVGIISFLVMRIRRNRKRRPLLSLNRN